MADDGWIGNGGAPKLMQSHPSIRMVSEVIAIHVERQTTEVEADFWFRNEGPATSARIGFPDENSGVGDPGRGPVLKGFASWVDGRRVKTRFEATEGRGWHIKTVRFPAHAAVHIRNRYTVKTGLGRIAANGRFVSYAHYTMSTGASWHGRIGEASVAVSFGRTVPSPTRLLSDNPFAELPNGKAADPLIGRYRRAVLWQGFSRPRLSHGKLIFYRRNFEPTNDDDIQLMFFPRHDRALERVSG